MTVSATKSELSELLPYLSAQEIAELDQLTKSRLWEPLEGPQTEALNTQADITFYGGAAGGGKGQALDAPILTPFGFRPMGSLKVGSAVCSPDGSVTSVIGIYPLGSRQLYRCKFHDGTSCEVTDDHIWLAWKARNGSKSRSVRRYGEESARLWTTRQLIGALDRGVRPIMPIANAVKFTDSARYPRRPVDPYLLGVLLGDGSITEKCFRISSADPEIPARIEARTGIGLLGPYKYGDRVAEYRLKEPNDIRCHLSKWGLIGKGSAEKFIPPAYLLGSENEREELLRGLMDTDGWADADGDTYYCTISKKLKDDVASLARSLGAMVTIVSKDSVSQNGNGCKSYTLRIKTRHPGRIFSLPRKTQICADKKVQTMGRRLVSIEPTRIAKAQCIKVSHPDSLYITDDYIVTHNTDLAIGLALTKHLKTLIMRREAPQLQGIFDRMTEILGSRSGFNSQDKIWRLPGRQVEFGSAPHPGDEIKFQGRPHDLLVYDEITHFLEKQVRFMMGWLRTTTKGQRTRVLFTGNPPTDSNGDWVIKFFAPWLDNKHPNPAKPGELRWYAVIEGEDTEVDGPEPFEHKGHMIKPQSRTFIPSLVTDNPYLMNTDYVTQLQSLPEPLRSQMLYGDFSAGRTDGEWQIIPTRWVDDAMERWRKFENAESKPMQAIGVDVARGGQDKMILAPRRGARIDPLIEYPGHEVPDGRVGASVVIKHMEAGCVPLVDLIGWGASCFDHLTTFGVPAVALNGSETDNMLRDHTGRLKFFNKRAFWYWQLRDLLDPRNGFNIQLPPDPEIKADLCSVEYKFTVRGIQAEGKEEIKKRIGRSPDKGDAIVYAFAEDVSRFVDENDYDPYNDHFEGRSSLTGY